MIIFVLSSSKNVIFLVFLMRVLSSSWSQSPSVLTFSFNNFIWIIKKYHFPCDFDALFLIFLKIFVFHLICKYIFFHRDFKGKNNYKYGCVRQLFSSDVAKRKGQEKIKKNQKTWSIAKQPSGRGSLLTRRR